MHPTPALPRLPRLPLTPPRTVKRLSCLLLGAASLLFSHTAAAQAKAPLFDRLPAAIQSARTIKLVGDSFPPYRIVEADGRTVSGIETDLARAMEPLLGVKFEQTIVSNLPAMLAGIDTGRYDLTSGPLLSTRKREERYDMIPWLLSKPAWLLPASAAPRVRKLEDLCGMRISFSAGSVSEEYQRRVSDRCVAAGLPAVRDVSLQEKDTLVLAVQSGRADAASTQLAVALHMVHQSPGKFHVQTDQTDALGLLHLGFVFRKGAELAPVMLEALRQLQSSGEYDRILAKWGMAPARQPVFRLNPSSSTPQ